MFKELNILQVFFDDPNREFSVRDVAKASKITPATASKYLQEFEKQQLLSYRHERGADLYKANQESGTYRDLKTYFNITKIRKSGIIDALTKEYHKPTIILFGSTSNGLDTKESDIDLLVISERKKEFSERKIYEKKLNRTLQVFIQHDLRELRNEHLINSVLNGIVLQGEIQWTSMSAKF